MPVVKNMQTRRLTKAVCGIVACLAAYAGAVSLSARDQVTAFRAPRSPMPAIAALRTPVSEASTLAFVNESRPLTALAASR